ncbi:bifunctional 2-polyprenyl-6-hydroxyphenol methylase/3-demethylubiquinol 3-O-methyltransferase UbiG [Bradyrhizobium sp. JYMT SZCCT0428]|uniref:class I SAM-dependent methyltransferase n=1 Tax=Bradyrhizobium sp. JYMT SZCCT0428 TaxID=2807673 RepID=UPI001BA62657|nr:class I SAM-dependent methyltransferase [Bradyrhizobium sp. JYMT SZCCT0428]MBR1153687.1 class I SAM-dependent methyltransferase [Bradyrhizobium sp. JYMT SZCCT0428]
MSDQDIKATTAANADFWDELCGSQAAKQLGVVDSSPASLKKFDDWYFAFYPYLDYHIPFGSMKGKRVLEIGLGYGTVSQRIAESGAIYTGLDIAQGPVKMINHRLEQLHLPGKAVQGSILEPPFEEGSFDMIVAIGCLHHTGDLALAIDRCHRLLRPAGQLILMVYSAYSYRRFWNTPKDTLWYFARELAGYRGVIGLSSNAKRAAYDINSSGDGAPHTDWISIRSLENLCKKFVTFSACLENIDQEPPFVSRSRNDLLTTRWPRQLGLDIYATCTK